MDTTIGISSEAVAGKAVDHVVAVGIVVAAAAVDRTVVAVAVVEYSDELDWSAGSS